MSKRLLFLDASPVYGGAQRSLFEFIRSLDTTKYQAFMLTADPAEDGLGGRCRNLGLTEGFLPVHAWERDLPGYVDFFTDLMRAWKWLPKWVEQCEIDLVYANGIRSALLASLVLPKSVPLLFHHRDYHCPAWALRLVSRRAQATVVVSDFLRRRVLEVAGQNLDSRLFRVYNGMPLEEIRKKSGEFNYPEHFRWGEQPALVAMVGDFVRWKRHDLFLRAVAIAARQCPQLQAFVVGGPRDEAGEDYGQELVRLAEQLHILDRVYFTDQVDKPYPLLRACRVVASVADNEPFGRSVVEALALGKPMVITPGGGPEEITAGCPAVQVVAPEPEAVAAGLLAALEAPAAMAQAASQHADRFAADKQHPHLRAVVDGILAV